MRRVPTGNEVCVPHRPQHHPRRLDLIDSPVPVSDRLDSHRRSTLAACQELEQCPFAVPDPPLANNTPSFVLSQRPRVPFACIERDTLHPVSPSDGERRSSTGSVLHCRQRRGTLITSGYAYAPDVLGLACHDRSSTWPDWTDTTCVDRLRSSAVGNCPILGRAGADVALGPGNAAACHSHRRGGAAKYNVRVESAPNPS